MSFSALRGSILGYDTETTGLNPWRSQAYKAYGMVPARPFAFSFFDAYGNSAYIRWEVNPKTREVIKNKRDIKNISELCGDLKATTVGHHIAFDIRMSRMSGIKFDWTNIQDTLFMAHILTSGALPSYALKELGEKWLGISKDDQDALIESVKLNRSKAKKKGWAISNKVTHGKDYIKSDYWLGEPGLCKKYALGDTERTMLLFLGMVKELEKEPKLKELYKMEIDLMRIVYRMELRGVRVFPEELKKLRKFYFEYHQIWHRKVKKYGGKDLNFNSPKQLADLFYKKKKYKVQKYTKTHQPCIDNSQLARLAVKDKFAKAILECKASDSMVTKFINPYERFMAPQKGVWVLHPNFRQCGPTTGRFACADPTTG